MESCKHPNPIWFDTRSIMRPAEIIERTASVSILNKTISDWGVYMVPYLFHTISISILKSYCIH